MDWLTIACLVTSAGALVAYMATAERPKPRPPVARKIQGNDAWRPIPARAADPELIDHFIKALKSPSRPAA